MVRAHRSHKHASFSCSASRHLPHLQRCVTLLDVGVSRDAALHAAGADGSHHEASSPSGHLQGRQKRKAAAVGVGINGQGGRTATDGLLLPPTCEPASRTGAEPSCLTMSSDSPVSADSFTFRSELRSTMPSAGTSAPVSDEGRGGLGGLG